MKKLLTLLITVCTIVQLANAQNTSPAWWKMNGLQDATNPNEDMFRHGRVGIGTPFGLNYPNTLEALLHLRNGRLYVQNYDPNPWVEGFRVRNDSGIAIMSLSGYSRDNRYVALLRLTKEGVGQTKTWSLVHNQTNDFLLEADNNNNYRRPFQVKFSAPTNSLYINQNGKVGIGTDNPQTPLHVIGDKIVIEAQDDPNSSIITSGIDLKMTGYGNTNYWSVHRRGQTFAPNPQESNNFLISYFNNSSPTPHWVPAQSIDTFGNVYFRRVAIALGLNALTNMPGGNTDGYKLYVGDSMLAEKIKVALRGTSAWSDYVFEKDYQLMPLADVESYIKQNKHLPNIPSAQEVVEKGLDLAEMDAKLLAKIEELTLHLIEIEKQNIALKKRLETLETTK
jgi:hypothetical protein